MGRSRVLAAAGSFSLLGVAFGYVLASAYVTYRFGGSLERIDFLFLARNALELRERAPAEFLAAAAIVGACVVLGLGLSGLAAQEGLTQFGSAAWQTRRQMKRNGFLAKPGSGFLLGKLGEPRSGRPFLVSDRFPHALLVAPTGRGKGVGFVIPNLLTFRGSVVVLDVKGENFRETAVRRLAMKDRVIRFAPADWSGKATHRYNSLSRIYALPNADQRMMELRLTAGLFLQADSDRVSGLLQGGVNIFVAAGMLAFERGRPTLGEIYRIAAGGGDKQKAYVRLAREVNHPAAQLLFQSLASINNDTLTSYLSLLLTSGLDTWANPAIDAATAACDFSFRDLRRSPHAVYLEVAPEMVSPLAPLIRLFFSDLIASLQAKEPGPDERLHVMIILDEFDRLGRMPIVAESIKTLRSYKGHLALITQTIPALDEIYGENTRLSLQGGAGIKLYLTPSDEKTIRHLSESLGTTTKRVVSRSRPVASYGLRSRTVGETTQPAPLLSEDEVRAMSLDDVVLVIDAQPPIRAKRIKYYEDPVLSAIHKAQAGELPYLDPKEAKLAAMESRADAKDSRIAALEGQLTGTSQPDTAPNLPAAPAPAPGRVPVGPVATELGPSTRRERIKGAVQARPAEALAPQGMSEADAALLRSQIPTLLDLAGQPTPGTPERSADCAVETEADKGRVAHRA